MNDLRVKGLTALDERAVQLPNGTEVTTRVPKVVKDGHLLAVALICRHEVLPAP